MRTSIGVIYGLSEASRRAAARRTIPRIMPVLNAPSSAPSTKRSWRITAVSRCAKEHLNKPIIPWSRVCRVDRLRLEPSLTVLALRFGAMAGVLVA